MKVSSLSGWSFMVIGVFGGLLWAEPIPHPTHAGRLVDECEGIRVEYSPGQEAYVEPFARRLAAWNREHAERTERLVTEQPEPLPLSARYLRERRDEILAQIAAELGLDAPTPLQGRSFDALLSDYELMEQNQRMAAAFFVRLAQTSEAAVWTRDEVKQHLSAGEPMPGFSIDPVSGEAVYNFTVTKNFEPTAEEEAYKAEVERRGLDHDFLFRTQGTRGIELSATIPLAVTGEPEGSADGPLSARPGRSFEEYLKLCADAPDLALPIGLEKANEEDSPDELAHEAVGILRGIFRNAEKRLQYRDGSLVLAVLHEAAEAGLVERYLGGEDRRWLCEGMANYVAWKVARDRAGAAFAREVYDLDGDLANAAGFQRGIDLRRWRTVEKQSEQERAAPLNSAHYAFATRAVFEIALQNGEDFLPKLFRNVGKTPRDQTSMKTVGKVYRDLTGKRIEDVIRAAERTPVPVSEGRSP